MIKIITDILTLSDGITYCHARVSGAATTVVYWAMAISDIAMNHHFDPISFATGYAAILAAVCGGAWMKKATEAS
jgi:hypothetical protein